MNSKSVNKLIFILNEFNSNITELTTLEVLRMYNEIIYVKENHTFFEHLLYYLNNDEFRKGNDFLNNLFIHNLNCQKINCSEKGCFLSKSVFRHYWNCTNNENYNCSICKWTKDAIKENKKNYCEKIIISKAIIHKRTIENENEIVCNICHNKTESMIQVKCCKQLYHLQCLTSWCLRNSHSPNNYTCPTCRKKFEWPKIICNTSTNI
jgi:hypothetical protein